MKKGRNIRWQDIFSGVRLEDLHLREIWQKSRRGAVYGLILILFLLTQNVLFSRIKLFGVSCMYIPALVIAVALFEGGEAGGWFGLAAGAMTDLFCTSQSVLFTVAFPVMGFAAGFLADFFMNRRFFTYVVMATAALLLSAFLQMFGLMVYQHQSSIALWGVAILQTLWSLPFLFPAYYVCKIIPRKIGAQVPSPYKNQPKPFQSE